MRNARIDPRKVAAVVFDERDDACNCQAEVAGVLGTASGRGERTSGLVQERPISAMDSARGSSYPSADLVGRCLVFNISHNKYRLIVRVTQNWKRLYVRHVLTHKQYDSDSWKKDCGG